MLKKILMMIDFILNINSIFLKIFIYIKNLNFISNSRNLCRFNIKKDILINSTNDFKSAYINNLFLI